MSMTSGCNSVTHQQCTQMINDAEKLYNQAKFVLLMGTNTTWYNDLLGEAYLHLTAANQVPYPENKIVYASIAAMKVGKAAIEFFKEFNQICDLSPIIKSIENLNRAETLSDTRRDYLWESATVVILASREILNFADKNRPK